MQRTPHLWIVPDLERRQGAGLLECPITADGNVENVRVIQSVHPDFDKAVMSALAQWKFRPATLHGKPVAVYYNLTVNIHPS